MKEVKALNGKSVPLIDVFVHSLNYIREHVLEELGKVDYNPHRKIQWVITIPAICSFATRQFMRKVAHQVNYIISVWSDYMKLQFFYRLDLMKDA